MRAGGSRRPPWPARMLLALVRGAGAEYLRGDLEERWWRCISGDGSAAWFGDAVRTVLSWWHPAAVRRRVRLARASAGPVRDGWPADCVRDARQVIRGLGRSPGFALLVIATLGLGIAATTTIYSVVDAVVVRALPYADAGELVAVGHVVPGRAGVPGTSLQALQTISGPTFLDWRERTRALRALAAVEFRLNLVLDENRVPHVYPFADATPGFLELLGARIQLGRSFLREDALETDPVPVILSDGAWSATAGSDPSILGRPAPGISGTRVIGVLAAEFVSPEALFGGTEIDYWRPMDIRGSRYPARADRRLRAIGRLAPGASVDAARADLADIQRRVARDHSGAYVARDGSVLGAGVNALQAQTVGATGRTLLLFLASAGLLLLIAAINAANLLAVRGLDREREVAVRLALGASRLRVARTALLESVFLAIAGGALGALLAVAGVAAFLRWVPPTMPRLGEVALDGRVLGISAIGTIVLGFGAGLVPALRQGVYDLASHARSAGATAARAGLRLRMSLVASQLALAVVLGVGATLLFRSFVNVATADPGFEPAGLFSFEGQLKRADAEAMTARDSWDELLAGVRSVPGVTAAAASALPFRPPGWAPAIRLEADAPATHRLMGAGYIVTPGYFGLLGAQILAGRDFDTSDAPSGRPVAIVNRAFVRTFFGEGDGIGRRIGVWGDDGSLTERQVVGVVDDVVQARAEDGVLPAVYVPYTQAGGRLMSVVLRSSREPADVARELRVVAARFNPISPPPSIDRMTDGMRETLVEPRFRAFLFIGFAGVAVLLAAVGLYGTLAHAVGRRTRELGIRMAVGADRASIFSLVMRQGMVVAGLGLALGLAGAALATRLLQSYLFGVGALDARSFVQMAILLLAVAALAIVRPARRATTIDPVRSIRSDG